MEGSGMRTSLLAETNPQMAAFSLFSAGIFSHLALFIHGEWDVYAPQIIGLYSALNLAAWTYVFQVEEASFVKATGIVTIASSLYFAGLFSSILVYRAFFHRLHSFGGPFGAKLTNFWSVWKCVPDLRWNFVTQTLHSQYGDFVRTRSREISINHADAVQAIHGPQSKCMKGPSYDGNYPATSLHTMRDRAAHNKRRRVWDRAFSKKSLDDYQPRVSKHTSILVSQLASQTSHPVDASQWFNYFSFDLMGDLAFGKDFDMLKTGKSHFVLEHLHKTMEMAGMFSGVAWSFRVLKQIPGAQKVITTWDAWVKSQVDERKRMSLDLPDIFSWLIDPSLSEGTAAAVVQIGEDDLNRDAELIIIAGSDTTSATLTNAFFCLSKHPEYQKALQREVDSFPRHEADIVNSLDPTERPFLDAVINETLRLFPPVPSGVSRVTPKEGMTIAGRFIPGDTIVSIPTHTIQRDPRNFEDPNSFIPERWFSKPELIHRKDAFIPFLTGAYSCVGKQLALTELRSAISAICQRFEFRLADDKSETIFTKEPGPRDTFTLTVAPLWLVFEERK